MLLGAGGSLQETFVAIRNRKRAVSLTLVTGEEEAGLVVNAGDGYVVLRPDPSESDDSFDVLVAYAAIVSVRVNAED
jgi:hypothetical protein